MRLALAILAAFLVIAAGCTAPPAQQPNGTQGAQSGGTPSVGTPSGSTGGSSSGGNVMDLNACVVNCNILEDTKMVDTCKSGCYMDAAEESRDASKCDPIATMNNMSIFYATCLGNTAGVIQDISPCNRLSDPDDKDFCIVVAADEYKNPAICQGVTNEIYRSVCIDDTNASSGK